MSELASSLIDSETSESQILLGRIACSEIMNKLSACCNGVLPQGVTTHGVIERATRTKDGLVIVGGFPMSASFEANSNEEGKIESVNLRSFDFDFVLQQL